MRTIPQRELRNDIARILREVESGERIRITVNGRPIAELIPIPTERRTFVPWTEIRRLLEQAPLDSRFFKDIDVAIGVTIDELDELRT